MIIKLTGEIRKEIKKNLLILQNFDLKETIKGKIPI